MSLEKSFQIRRSSHRVDQSEPNRPGWQSLKDSKTLLGLSFVGPAVIGIIFFTYLPIISALYLSFCEGDFISPPEWVGVANYERLWKDPVFWLTVKNTVFYVIITVPVGLSIALALAVVLNQRLRGMMFLRAIFFLPMITSGTAISMMFFTFFNPYHGLLNQTLSLLGIRGPHWLGDPRYVMWAVAFVGLWQGLAGNLLIFLAGLQGIPNEMYEAAAIDGAGTLQQFVNVTLPLLTPTIFLNMVLAIINSFQVFEYSYMMTGGGPRYASSTLVFLVWLKAFTTFEVGYGASIAFVLFALITIVTGIQFLLQRYWVCYDL